jgi:membrane-associated phospholipid phosphatase
MTRWRLAAIVLVGLSAVALGNTVCFAHAMQLSASATGANIPSLQAPTQPQADQNALGHNTSAHAASGENTSGVQQDSTPNDQKAAHENALSAHLLKVFLQDQKAIWTCPAHVHLVDADWLIPLGAATGIMLATDTEYSKHLSNSPSRIKRSGDVSNYGIGALAGVGAGFYFLGYLTHDEHQRETGFLAGEAAIDSLVPTYVIKYAFGRERPLQDNYRGDFFKGGVSFPSEHAAAAWSIASVIAHEYPGPLTSVLAYGAASAISFSRVSAKQHFPSDVLIGSAIGWLVGAYVYRTHHNPDLSGAAWPTYAESQDGAASTTPAGSPYVELDSWIYPAIERLAALGYIDSAFLGMRPWTRAECARLVEEASENIEANGGMRGDVYSLYLALQSELQGASEALVGASEGTVHLESLYANVTGISGPPLNDSYHFGQTIINNYGRPYQEGFNSYDGFSGYATAGRYAIYVRGEYQHAPFAPAYSLPIRQFIATVDQNPLQPATPFATVNQFRLLDTYVSATAANWNFAFGKQSLWWGPDYGSALIFSDNAEPIYMFRASRIVPFTLPWIFGRLLGPMKLDAFFGKLSGNDFPPRPLIHGEKVSFKPTKNLEFGFTRMAQMGGVGRPLTPAAVFNSYFGIRNSDTYAANANPGKRTGGFDFSYRLPLLRDWVSIYTDALSSDDISPLSSPRRAAINPGIYLVRFPKIPRLDLRVEAVNTNTPSSSRGGHLTYFDFFYHDLSTNKRNLFASWIGRDGTGIQAWSTYRFGARNNLQFGYRHATISGDFIPGGETVNDGSAKFDCWLGGKVNVSAGVQYEKWFAPILATTPQTNWTSSVGVSFWPHLEAKLPSFFGTQN